MCISICRGVIWTVFVSRLFLPQLRCLMQFSETRSNDLFLWKLAKSQFIRQRVRKTRRNALSTVNVAVFRYLLSVHCRRFAGKLSRLLFSRLFHLEYLIFRCRGERCKTLCLGAAKKDRFSLWCRLNADNGVFCRRNLVSLAGIKLLKAIFETLWVSRLGYWNGERKGALNSHGHSVPRPSGFI